MGAAAGIVCYLSCSVMKTKFGYDDSLDAFGVHGVGGTFGAILTGVFATRAVGSVIDSSSGSPITYPLGLLEGGNLLTGQIVATAISWVYAGAVSFVLLKVLDATMGLRVTEGQEREGLDQTQHGEEGYLFI